MLQPSAATVRELRAVALGLRLVDKDTKKAINASVRSVLNPIWIQAIQARLVTKLDRLTFGSGARIAAGNPSRAMAGTSRRPVGDGMVPVEIARAVEFGAPTRVGHVSSYSLEGVPVERHTKRGLPKAVKQGRIVYPAWAELGPRLVSLWVQIIVRTIHEKLEGK